jgi:hypothetical protein
MPQLLGTGMHFIHGLISDPMGAWDSLSMTVKVFVAVMVVLAIYVTIKGFVIRR